MAWIRTWSGGGERKEGCQRGHTSTQWTLCPGMPGRPGQHRLGRKSQSGVSGPRASLPFCPVLAALTISSSSRCCGEVGLGCECQESQRWSQQDHLVLMPPPCPGAGMRAEGSPGAVGSLRNEMRRRAEQASCTWHSRVRQVPRRGCRGPSCPASPGISPAICVLLVDC